MFYDKDSKKYLKNKMDSEESICVIFFNVLLWYKIYVAFNKTIYHINI
jgi:hypothetical protein